MSKLQSDLTVEEALIAETISRELQEGLANLFHNVKMDNETTKQTIKGYVMLYLQQLDFPKPEIDVTIDDKRLINIKVSYGKT